MLLHSDESNDFACPTQVDSGDSVQIRMIQKAKARSATRLYPALDAGHSIQIYYTDRSKEKRKVFAKERKPKAGLRMYWTCHIIEDDAHRSILYEKTTKARVEKGDRAPSGLPHSTLLYLCTADRCALCFDFHCSPRQTQRNSNKGPRQTLKSRPPA